MEKPVALVVSDEAMSLDKVPDVSYAHRSDDLGQNPHLHGYVPVTAEERALNRRLNRKLDMFIMGFCALIYIFNGLDRSNIGNAETAGLSTDLVIPASTINTAASLMFASYIPCSPISTVVGKKVGLVRWLSIIGFSWGVISIGTAFVKTAGQLIGVRILLGAFECGLYSVVMSYLTLFYPRYNVAFRIALFYSCYAMATAFGGIIAYGCFQIHGALYNWQYLFLIEGSGSVLIAIVTPFWLPKDPQSAWFLNEQEKEFAAHRMRIDSAANVDKIHSITKRDLIEALKDWKMYMLLLPNICQGVSALGLTTFFPIVVKALGYTGPTANLMTIPPYVAGCLVVLCVAYLSDRYQTRIWGLLFGLTLCIIGLVMTITIDTDNPRARYAGLVILISGSFVGSPLQVAWLTGNTPEPGMRTAVLGMNGFGNTSGLIGSLLFLPKFGPTYHTPLKITLALVAVAFASFCSSAGVFKMVNLHRAKVISTWTPEQIEEENRSDKRYGDKKMTFVYGC